MTESKWNKPIEAECIGQCPECRDFQYRNLETGEIFYSNGKEHCSCTKVVA